MDNNLKFRILTIVAVTLACVFFIIGIPKSKADIINNWNNNIRLGLDLRGGTELILQVNLQDAFKATADSVIDKMRDSMHAASIDYTDIDRNDPQIDSGGGFDSGHGEGRSGGEGGGVPATVPGQFRGRLEPDSGGPDGLHPDHEAQRGFAAEGRHDDLGHQHHE